MRKVTPLPGQRQADVGLLADQADQAAGVDRAVHLDHRPIAGGQRARASRPGTVGGQSARSLTPSRDGKVLTRVPSSSTCRLAWSTQRVTCRPETESPLRYLDQQWADVLARGWPAGRCAAARGVPLGLDLPRDDPASCRG
jgi:hypothetical protein